MGVEWTYCTNVHSLHTWKSWKKAISFFGIEVKQHLKWNKMPLGLWFNDSVAREILGNTSSWEKEKESVQNHLGFLDELGISSFTLNTFPFGNFQQRVVKTEVYKPDWSNPSRLAYTIRCGRILSHLMGSRTIGTMSTLPLGWKQGWKEEKTIQSVKQLINCVDQLRILGEERGKILQLCIEAEPGCVLETTKDILVFWEMELRPMAKKMGISEDVLARHCGICYDTCHQAVQFEDGVDSLKRLQDAEISIGKMQLSNALEFFPDKNCNTLAMRELFVEERFLHQTRIYNSKSGEVFRYNDLPNALKNCNRELWAMPWRVHYHLPLFSHKMLQEKGLGTTIEEMKKVFKYALHQNICKHFEVETYTWDVLPKLWRPSNDKALAKNIAMEIQMIEMLSKE